jgi:hypothetical protein
MERWEKAQDEHRLKKYMFIVAFFCLVIFCILPDIPGIIKFSLSITALCALVIVFLFYPELITTPNLGKIKPLAGEKVIAKAKGINRADALPTRYDYTLTNRRLIIESNEPYRIIIRLSDVDRILDPETYDSHDILSTHKQKRIRFYLNNPRERTLEKTGRASGKKIECMYIEDINSQRFYDEFIKAVTKVKKD